MPVKLTFPKIKLPACKSNPPVTLGNEAPPFSCEEMGKMKKASELKNFYKRQSTGKILTAKLLNTEKGR